MSLVSLTIHEVAEKLKAKEISSLELTRACLERIKKLEPELKAYTLVTEEIALEAAKKADSERAENSNRGTKNSKLSPLHGIPVALKDVFCTKDVRTTACSNILKNFVPPYDATTVKRLRAAGMVLLGKTNTDEFTCGASTETSCFGTSHNPWDLKRTPGGSSGGSAVAVAADECIYSLGTDTGGSIRQPASYCGVTGLKVTYGRVSRFGVISMASSLDTIGPIAKDVADIALIMNEIAGRDSHDSTTPDEPVPDYTENLNAKNLKGLKIGIPKEYFAAGLDPEIEKAVREAIKKLGNLSADMHEISLPHSMYALAVYYIICPSEVSANMARYDSIRYGTKPSKEGESLFEYYLNARGQGFGEEMKRRIMLGTYALSAGYYDAYYLKAQKVRTLVKQDFEKAFENVDAMVAPVTPTTAFKIGEKAADPVKMYLEDILTTPVSITGVPALSVPCGFSKEGSPIGLQIIGPQFGEPVLLKIGAAFQRETDWHKRKPKI